MDWFTLSIVDQIINKAESVDKSSDIKNHNLKGKKKITPKSQLTNLRKSIKIGKKNYSYQYNFLNVWQRCSMLFFINVLVFSFIFWVSEKKKNRYR